MKRILLATVVLASAAAGAGYLADPAKFTRYAGEAELVGHRAWDGVLANPAPVALGAGTFLLTVLYHTAKGKTFRESVEVAATRVAVVPVPGMNETAVVARAKARATRAQLLADQVGLQNRLRKLPDEVTKAEKDACFTEHAMADAERVLATRRKAHDEAITKLDALRDELEAGEAELAAIVNELQKLAAVA